MPLIHLTHDLVETFIQISAAREDNEPEPDVFDGDEDLAEVVYGDAPHRDPAIEFLEDLSANEQAELLALIRHSSHFVGAGIVAQSEHESVVEQQLRDVVEPGEAISRLTTGLDTSSAVEKGLERLT
ncbi:hypothetical protein RBI13_23075 [Alcaligenaceae bacterium A4P071]|nr:hypothetical protein [Alcaligenaceae bacterium B3P038]MDQ2188070.1 hypothetical protein [Alcaligenaceae bacterium A4P071]